jgi:cold shock CspA family protein
METKTAKKFAILTKWDEARGFGFLSSRNPDGTRRSWFLHHTGIQHIEEGGIPQLGAEVYFNEKENPRGVMAVDCEIKALAPKKIHQHAILNSLAGETGAKS